MIIKKLTACMLALCLALTGFAAGAPSCAQAEEMAVEEDFAAVMSAAPASAPEETAQAEEAAEEQMAQDEVVLDSAPTLIAPSEPHEEEVEQAVQEAETYRPAYDRGEGPVYVLENGARHFGRPEEFIPLDKTIYLYNYLIIEISGYTIQQLRNVSFALGGGFSASDVIYLSERSPGGRTKDGVVFLWAGPDVGLRDNSYRLGDVIDADADEYLETEIMVSVENYEAGTPCQPVFTLSAIPEPADGAVFAVSLEDQDAQILTGSQFAPAVSGSYRFMLLDASGEELARSRKYVVTVESDVQPEEEVWENASEDEVFTGAPSVPEDEEVSMEFTVEEDDMGAAEGEMLEDTMESYAGAQSDEEEGFAQDAITLPNGATFDGSSMTDEVAYAESQNCELTVKQLDEATFELSGLPEDGQHVYTVQLDGGAPAALLSSSYTAGVSGEYVFAICDAVFNVLAASDAFRVTLDEQADPAADAAYALSVTPGPDAVSQGWTNQPVTFTLSAAPALTEGLSYAALINGAVADVFTAQAYTPDQEGEYTLSFAIVDGDSRVLCTAGESYAIRLDLSAPLLIATPLDNYVLRIVVGDMLSHGATVKISTDGGKTFTPGLLKYQGEGVSTCEFVASTALKLAPGSIVVADTAGNTTASTAPVVLYSSMEQLQQMAGMASLGGFSHGGGGGSYRSVSHSHSDVDDVTAYNAVRLVVDDGSMTQLVVGDETLDLQLQRDSFSVDETLSAPAFTAEFTAWDGRTDDGVDTLILAASDPEEMLDEHSYTWSFSGAVYKKLAASGIDYLVLRIGDQATVLSTAGFSAGIRYNMYRAEGLPSKDFRYDVRMAQTGGAFEMDVTVSGETYRMSADPAAEFYYYDVYNGSAAQFGALAEG